MQYAPRTGHNASHLPPGEQKAVGRILAACGAAEPVEFDAYTELFDFDLRLTSEEIPGNQGI